MKKMKTIAAAVIAGAVAAGGAGAAFAAPDGDAGSHTIDPAARSSLTVFKKAGTETGNAATGEDMAVDRDGLGGVRFSLYSVGGIDMTTNAGLAAASKVALYQPTAEDVANGFITVEGVRHDLTLSKSLDTDSAEGKAVFSSVPLGVYVVSEDLAHSGEVTNVKTRTTVDKSSITPSLPFVVSLPSVSADGRTWNHDVKVYPKNHLDTIKKEVLDAGKAPAQDGYKVDDVLTYRLTASVQAGDKDKDGDVDSDDLGGVYEITDTLSKHLTYQGVSGVKVVTADGASTPLTETDDYTVVNDQGKVTVALTVAGINKVAPKTGGTVQLNLTAKVVSVPQDGAVTNTAAFIPSHDAKVFNKDGIPSNTVESSYGSIVVKKTDQKGTGLPGAVFKVYAAAGDGTCDPKGAAAADPIASATSGKDGYLAFTKIPLSNHYDGKDQNVMRSYCLEETKAPEGYTLLAQPVKFDLTVKGVVDTGDLATAYARDDNPDDTVGGSLHVTNVKEGILPSTGAGGYVAMTALGLGVAAVGGAATVAARRKARNS